ncbi:MAG: hypothetical protein AAGH60_10640 [Pseudomonadota bacterium]
MKLEDISAAMQIKNSQRHGSARTSSSLAEGSVTPRRNAKRYTPFLAAALVPALLSGGAAAIIYADGSHQRAQSYDLVTRVKMLRQPSSEHHNAIDPTPTFENAKQS